MYGDFVGTLIKWPSDAVIAIFLQIYSRKQFNQSYVNSVSIQPRILIFFNEKRQTSQENMAHITGKKNLSRDCVHIYPV